MNTKSIARQSLYSRFAFTLHAIAAIFIIAAMPLRAQNDLQATQSPNVPPLKLANARSFAGIPWGAGAEDPGDPKSKPPVITLKSGLKITGLPDDSSQRQRYGIRFGSQRGVPE